ncbi:MerR family transcriptional regulator [Microbacterium sp. NPDC058389]|uniref:MerR family transcriptional regulator n=1 Tax=Microbacterium sp. NPDC058389 TaxID=3346475 RepID=UPI00365E48D6
MLTTGQIASHAELSEKAVRLYTDKGLLTARRDEMNRRVYESTQTERARRIALLRGLDLSLTDVRAVLDADDIIQAFDEVWAVRRTAAVQMDLAGEHARDALAGRSKLQHGLELRSRETPDRAVLRVGGEVVLSDIPRVLPSLAERLLAALGEADAPVTGPLFVEYCARAVETFPATLRVCAPFGGRISPRSDMEIVLDPAHTEVFVALQQAQATDQALVVAVHDHLSFLHGANRTGPNREIYYPTFGTGVTGDVMDIAIPVSPTTA